MPEVSPALIVRLLEEQLWCNFDDVAMTGREGDTQNETGAIHSPYPPQQAATAAPSASHKAAAAAAESGNAQASSTVTYLQETVFPTLIPALHELMKRTQSFQDKQQQNASTSPGAPQCASKMRDSGEGKLNGEFSSRGWGGRSGPTGNTHPVSWLADYLVRNNTAHNNRLLSHQYNTVAASRMQK